ncbi:TPA: hypothetical protein ACH3X2_010581 [Trebouxia sp. C0005]
MVLLCKKGSHGVGVHGKQRSILPSNRLESWTLKNHVHFICNSHTTTTSADPIRSGYMLTCSKMSENNRQLMRAQSKLKKPLHAPTRNRQLTIPPMLAKRFKPMMVVCTCNKPNSRGCSGTMQGIVMGAAQMLTQGFDNGTNLSNRNSAPAKRHGLPNRLQTSSYGAEKILCTISNRKSIIKVVQQDCVKKRPNRASSYLVPKFKCLPPPKNLQW